MGLTLHDLADDVASAIRAYAEGPAVVLGHAFGNVLARVVTTDHPDLVTAVVLAAAEGSKVPENVGQAPFIAGDPTLPEAERLMALREAFFAPGHDPRIWLRGWYPTTLAMQREAVRASSLEESWVCGTVPLLQLIAEHDPFMPRAYWHELRHEFGPRVTAIVIENASHALFPEQPNRVANAVLSWLER